MEVVIHFRLIREQVRRRFGGIVVIAFDEKNVFAVLLDGAQHDGEIALWRQLFVEHLPGGLHADLSLGLFGVSQEINAEVVRQLGGRHDDSPDVICHFGELGIQEPVDDRVHDLSDAFCIVGPQSQAQKISGISTGAAQLRSDDGSTFFEINPTTQKIKIVAPGGLDVVTPQADFSAKVTIHGLLSWLGGMVGSVASGVASKITGAVEFIGTVKANGKSIDDTHTHGGVQHGTSNTDGVN